MKWDPGFLCSGDNFQAFWSDLATEPNSNRNGLLIAGRGFDPRTTVGPSAIMGAGFPITSCCLIQLKPPFDNPDRTRSRAAADNEATMRDLFKHVAFNLNEIPVLNQNGRPISFPHIRNLLTNPGWLAGFTDVIVDISAFPTSVSFPLLAILIEISDPQHQLTSSTFNLHCVVCENAEIDRLIVSEGGDVAEYIDPFRGQHDLAGVSDPITIWAPVLGERQSHALAKIHSTLGPVEVKPFLPSPSLQPRRGDEIVSEYRSLLFGTWGVDPRGFIYADERDPFDIYRQIVDLANDYTESLAPLGNAYTIVSAHSSKLLSLGVLLAAVERKLAVMHVEPTGYYLPETINGLESNELFEVWLTGEAYDTQ